MKYSIGIDYGTLSARAVLVCTDSGAVLAESEFLYPNGVMDETLPDKTPLEDGYALQNPQDYIDAFRHTVGELLKTKNVSAEDIVGIGIDFTSSTFLAVDENYTPLCFREEFKSEPFAYARLWKHHSADAEAEEITDFAKRTNQKWLARYGGRVSSEWFIPKIFETYRKARQVYDATYRFVEAGDWLVWLLTGNEAVSGCMAGYKGMWSKSDGFVPQSFFEEMDFEFGKTLYNKICINVLPSGSKAGKISENSVIKGNLNSKTEVCVSVIDAHATLPAVGITGADELMIIIGTSACHIIMDKNNFNVPGICGSVEDGIIPGYVAYESGQSSVGDCFDWFVSNCVPKHYCKDAKERGINVFGLLEEKADKLSAGESGLLAIDWWNGNRTPYADFNLNGLLFGLNLATKPEEIYRALVEATAFGTRRIVEIYEKNGLKIDKIYASGGISQKSDFLMGIYADVMGRKIYVPQTKQSGAFGMAIFAAVSGGCFKTMTDAVKVMVHWEEKVYSPSKSEHEKYSELYGEYVKLSEYFSKGETFSTLRKLKNK